VSHFLGDTPTPGNPVHLAFAVGGAGAQAEMVDRFLPSLAKRLRRGKMRLTLVAGIRQEVAQTFREAIARAGLGPEFESGAIRILLAGSHAEYFAAFDELLESVDVLWTKPSELTFYGALGLPLILSNPVGGHERYNARWALHSGAAVRQSDPRHAGDWIWEMLKDGTLAGAAWTGYMRMPKFGLYRIVSEVLGQAALEQRLLDLGVDSPQPLPEEALRERRPPGDLTTN
jgi:UDP-N-acetylglucosamine:LPS N-acetylglucosamine transferase